MTTPQQPPPEEGPPSYPAGPYGPSGWPPPGTYPPPPGYPQYPPGYYPYWQPPRKSGGEVVGLAFVGIILFWFTSFGMLVLVDYVTGGSTSETKATVWAVVLSILGLGGGLGLTIKGRGALRGLGIGLMIGWATVAILSGVLVGCIAMLEGLE